ncbi:probable protein phosphatase 2C 14 [Punica granatum]|uniref:protein-serine/threonine phosphatase n=2 Tax=Punica granatum TaxID=22663 RepID=A0A218XZH9_PUNGR|nr:probable protein phosphatase 2C 14 [Punica granatum]OWM89692.1 hypothetical protein CDL15_Pgr024440 [Punica granatum]PKI31121.1 hypothetical protein CRG98_048489 [Punica granatum]
MLISGRATSTTTLASSTLKRKRPPNIEIPNVLREVRPGELKLRDSTPKKSDAACLGSAAGVGVFSVKGKKKFMEDTHRIIPSFLGNPNKGFFGVYDGHGGRKAADFVAERLHKNIIEMVENCQSGSSKEEAVKAGYLKTDEEFLVQGLSSGACCVTALIEGQEIIISNLGDCRAVLSRGGVAEALTKDHRADEVIERQRIEDKGGYVEMHRGAWRVHGILAVSRSIGDAHLKQWVVAEPETTVLHLTSDMEYLVLASDGLWEEVGNQEAIDIISRLCMKEMKPLKLTDLRQDDNDDTYGRVNVSPSSKLRRVALVKQQKRASQQSPNHLRTCATMNGDTEEDDISCEIDGPPSKLRKISLMNRINPKPDHPSQENSLNAGFSSIGIVAACKELANLAVSRGSLDDITIMIIDLNCFRCNNLSSGSLACN